LAAVWPETSWRVHAFLRSRGLSESAAEDILQEIAVRALRTAVTYTCADDLVPWACTVGWRFHLGQLRKTTRECSPDRGDRPSTVDVEEEVISRAQMTHVIRAMSTLVESDRRALLETVVDETVTVVSPREAGRRAVARHRARARLLRAMQG
jgi:DNA-directed RNA polymerase specialized sigma24 family protein